MKKSACSLALIFVLLSLILAGAYFVNSAEANPIYEFGDLTVAQILSPLNKTYNTNIVPLVIVTGDHQFPSTAYYSVDGGPSKRINADVFPSAIFNGELNLADGSHTISVVTVSVGQVCAIVHFSIDTVPPFISLLSPVNKVYNSTTVPLEFEFNETLPKVTYSLGQGENVTIWLTSDENRTLSELSEGTHNLSVYAEDSAGNINFFTSEFMVDTIAPVINVISPENATYYSKDILVNFVVTESVSGMTYSLDGEEHVDIDGNFTLGELSYGSHSIVVHVKDEAGNMGASETLFFTVEEPFPTLLVIASVIIVIVVVVAVFLLMRRHKHSSRVMTVSKSF